MSPSLNYSHYNKLVQIEVTTVKPNSHDGGEHSFIEVHVGVVKALTTSYDENTRTETNKVKLDGFDGMVTIRGNKLTDYTFFVIHPEDI
jgi:hypothetical protein